MSRIGRKPVEIPAEVEVRLEEQKVEVSGPCGRLNLVLHKEIEIRREGQSLFLRSRGDSPRARAIWGTSRKLVDNLVVGTGKGFKVGLEISGVGYRASVQGREILLQLGYSHDIRYPLPEGITVTSERPTSLVVCGADRQLVGQVAAEIRRFRPPEPYKGKGIRYLGQVPLRKVGKKK